MYRMSWIKCQTVFYTLLFDSPDYQRLFLTDCRILWNAAGTCISDVYVMFEQTETESEETTILPRKLSPSVGRKSCRLQWLFIAYIPIFPPLFPTCGRRRKRHGKKCRAAEQKMIGRNEVLDRRRFQGLSGVLECFQPGRHGQGAGVGKCC